MEVKDGTRDTGPAVEVGSLIKRYGELVAVDGLSLKIPRDQVLGLLGPNGSGKTTTINCILQLLAYDKGSIRVFGEPMTPTAYELKRRIGVVPQDVAVFDELTVAENVNAFCALYVRDRTERRRLVAEAIAFVGLEKFVKFKPKKLSGGLLRRLNIACGIAHGPDLIILDEPTVAVDPQSRNAILDGIQASQRARRHHHLHEPLHGGGGATVPPDRHHGPRSAGGLRNLRRAQGHDRHR